MKLARLWPGLIVLAWAGSAAAAPPSYTAKQATRGEAAYIGSCAQCHGDGLDDGQFAPPLKGPPHATYWNGSTAENVLTYMSTMMPPTQPGGLEPQLYADIYAYMLKSAGAPAGDKELPADPAALKGFSPAP